MIVQRLTRDERGVAAVEFAITSPVYFLALFGLAQAGLWLWADFSLQRAADAASRWASIQCGPKLTACPTASQLQGYAVNNIRALERVQSDDKRPQSRLKTYMDQPLITMKVSILNRQGLKRGAQRIFLKAS
jgi:Flp pilus assembly protein TadG